MRERWRRWSSTSTLLRPDMDRVVRGCSRGRVFYVPILRRNGLGTL
jgi:hypothetical protein